MELLRQLQKEGFEVILGEDNRVGIRPADRISPELARQIRKHKAELIEALRKQRRADGYQSSKAYPPKPQHRCRACGEYDYWFSRYGVWTCRICHPPAPGAEVDPETYRLIEQASNTVPEPSKSTGTRRWCQGYQPPRYVHIDVCSWHVQEGDPKCANCPHLSHKDKGAFMDAYLDKTIAKLNARKAVYYRSSDPPGKRALIDDLERRITEAYLLHNVPEFIEVVDKWANLFLGGDNNAD